MLDRSTRLAAALRNLGIEDGDRVVTLSFNCHQLLEAYYGVPIARAVLTFLEREVVAGRARPTFWSTRVRRSCCLILSSSRSPMFCTRICPRSSGSLLRPAMGSPIGSIRGRMKTLLAAAEPEPVDFTAYDEKRSGRAFLYQRQHRTPQRRHAQPPYPLSACALCPPPSRAAVQAMSRADRMCEMHTIPLFHANGWGRPHTITFAGAAPRHREAFRPR